MKTVVPDASGHLQSSNSPRVLDDTSGQITELVVNFPTNIKHLVSPVFEQLLNALPSGVHLKVAFSNDEPVRYYADECKWMFRSSERQTDIIISNLRLTPWARDRRIARTDTTGKPRLGLVPPPKSWYGGDRLDELKLPYLLYQLGLAPDFEHLPCFLDGGNLVCDGRYAFVGGNNIGINGLEKTSASELKRVLQHFLGKEVVFVGKQNGAVPWDHLDMYLTPLPAKKVLVASHALAVELLKQANPSGESPIRMLKAIPFDQQSEQLFDAVASQFEKLGYEVDRLPAVPNAGEQWMLNYHNVLMDFRDLKPLVLMPTYDVPALDAYAAKLYESMGFEVRPINISILYQEGGGVRCFANVTRRTPSEPGVKSVSKTPVGHLRIHRTMKQEVEQVPDSGE